MTRRNKILLTIVGFLLLIFIVLLIWWLLGGRPAPAPTNINALPPVPTRLPVPNGTNATAVQPIGLEKPDIAATLKAVAATFAERYGSYSNEAGFTNVEDLESLMTPKMRSTAQQFMSVWQSGAGQGYVGVTTRALSVTLTAFDPNFGQAEAMVSTQRQEAKGSTINPRTTYQNLKLKLVQTGKGWQVDEAMWQ